MRILHTSDWHLGKSLYDFSLLEDQAFFLEELLGILEKERIDVVLVSGDIYDRPVPSAAAVSLYDRFLERAVVERGVRVIAVAGNHDSASRLSFGSELYKSAGYYVAGHPKAVPDSVLLEDTYGAVRFVLIPWLHPADARVQFDDDTIRTFDDAWGKILERARMDFSPGERRVAVAHGFFSDFSAGKEAVQALTSDSEVSVGGMDIVRAAHFDGFDYVALGHLHAPQWVRDGAIRYSGSPLKYSLSEEHHRKSVTVIELGEKGGVEAAVLPLGALRDVRTVSGTFEELCELDRQREGSLGDYVFAQISGPQVTWPMEKLRVVFPNILGLSFVDAPKADILFGSGGTRSRMGPEELFEVFYRDMRGGEMTEDMRAFLGEAAGDYDEEEALL